MVFILFPWNMDGHPDLSSWIELGFSPDSFLDVYSNDGNHTRVFVVSYAHGRILSINVFRYDDEYVEIHTLLNYMKCSNFIYTHTHIIRRN